MPKCPVCGRQMVKTDKEYVCDGLSPVGGSLKATHPIVRKQRFIAGNSASLLFLSFETKDPSTRKWLEDLGKKNEEVGKPRWHWYQKEDGTIVEKVGDKVVDILTVPKFCEKLVKELQERESSGTV